MKPDQLRFTIIRSDRSARANGAAALMRPSIAPLRALMNNWTRGSS